MLDGLVPPLLVIAAALALIAFRQGVVGGRKKRGLLSDMAVMSAVMCVTGVLELAMGRPLTYTNGPVKLWSGDVRSDQNSQQISDPYTATHIVHGAAFYGLTRAVLPTASAGFCAIVATISRSRMGGVPEHRSSDQSVSRRDDFARLLWR